MENEKFLKMCGITQKNVDEAKCTVEELKNIYFDFKEKCPQYEALGEYIINILQQENKKKIIHSMKFRVKDPKSLIKKIVEKNQKIVADGKKANRPKITFENYKKEITDFLWLKILLIDRNDWEVIHNTLISMRDFQEMIAYVPEGKEIGLYKKCFENVNQEKENSYFSLHYISKIKPKKMEEYTFEIQVKSLLDEARSELDHDMRYKNKKNAKDTILNSLFDFLFQKIDSSNALISLLKGYYVDKNPNWLRGKIESMDIPKSDKEEIISKLKESIKTTNMLSFYSQDTLKIIDTYKDKPYYNLLKEKLSNEASFMKENVYFLYTRDHTKKYSSEKYKTIFNNLRNNKIKK